VYNRKKSASSVKSLTPDPPPAASNPYAKENYSSASTSTNPYAKENYSSASSSTNPYAKENYSSATSSERKGSRKGSERKNSRLIQRLSKQ
jgi:hypothetical protein